MTHIQAKTYILRERGLHFDPDTVEAFVQTEKQFITIREQFKDEELREEQSIEGGRPDGTPAMETVLRSRDRVMIVDDDAVTREMIMDFLTAHGFEAASFDDPRKALESIKEQRPRLIISDWEMPHMDGLEFCRQVRAMVQGGHVHFTMLTVHASKDELCQAFDAGVDDFLAKPFDEVELMARLRSGLRTAAFYDEVLRQTQGSRQLNEQLMNLNHRLENLAITDDLTGLYNRREAMRRLEEQWSLSDRYQRPLTVVTLDIDHFKGNYILGNSREKSP
jgi:PleD family two-component response regulator